MKKPLIILAGPTAAGKTKLSVALAKKIGGEIISADSMQVYRGMDIGSAKIKPSEMEGIPHYLIDEMEPDEEFNVVKFQALASSYVDKIHKQGKIPILVGGTGFYIQALLYQIDFTATKEDSSYRLSLEQKAAKEGVESLHQMLARQDEKAAREIHPNNVKRVIRALEFYHQTGKKISEHNERERQKQSPYDYIYFVLTDDRQALYKNINKRVDQMMEDGLLAEVAALKKRGFTKELVSMQGLGYKELLSYLEGECTLEEATYILKRDTRHFAKRQLTWFKREKETVWIEKQKYNYDDYEILTEILEIIRQRINLEG